MKKRTQNSKLENCERMLSVNCAVCRQGETL